MTFGAEELYPTLIDKAAALCFWLVLNHPFVDGNKRIGHAAMETFLILNGHQLDADVDDAEQLFLGVAEVEQMVNHIDRSDGDLDGGHNGPIL